MSRSNNRLKFLLLTIAALFLALIAGQAPLAATQIDETEWMTPINLSESGAAGDVIVVEDSEGVVHVLWLDESKGFVYSRSEEEAWMAPVALELPFVAELTEQQETAGVVAELFVPQLLADATGHIHAFWLDDEAALRHSAVVADSFSEASSWSETETVAEGVLAMAVILDAAGSLHLAYMQAQDTEDASAGVYYRRSDNGVVSWTPAMALFQSAYFRSLPVEQANISLATMTTDAGSRVLVAWDLPSRERVFVIHSVDNGETWLEPRQVDRRQSTDAETAVGPSNIHVVTTGREVHLVWQAGHEGALCSQYHQWSRDGGDSWEEPQVILDELLVCPDAASLLALPDERLLLVATLEGNIQPGVYLTAWNGSRWSELREQAPLSNFTDPETLRPVRLGCRQELAAAEEIIVVGCSSGDVRDVWLLTRPLGDVAHWFPAPSPWQVAPILAGADKEIQFSVLVPDVDGRLHVLWAEADSDVIQYVHWDGSRWSTSLPVLTSPTGVVDRPAAMLTADRRLLVMWNDVEGGRIYTSHTGADRAPYAEDWLAPQPLPVQREGAASVDFLVEGAGAIYAAFAVPINEGRGIYLLRSDNLGESWSEPVLVFDAAANQWAMVDRPQLALTKQGHLHLLWTRYALPPHGRAQALMYTRSSDGGLNWSEPQVVVQAPLLWSQITAVAGGRVLRHWQEAAGDRVMLWQEATAHDGLNWSYTTTAANAAAAGAPTLVEDAAGRLHLVYQDGSRLHYRFWNGERWAQAESLVLGRTAVADVSSLAAAIISDGNLAVVFAGRASRPQTAAAVAEGSSQAAGEQPAGSGGQPFLLQFASRSLQDPDPLPAEADITAAPATVAVAAAPEATPTPPAHDASSAPTRPAAGTVAESSAREDTAASVLSDLTLEMIVALALLPAGLLVVLVLALGIHRTSRAE
jgi:hypothetical protein